MDDDKRPASKTLIICALFPIIFPMSDDQRPTDRPQRFVPIQIPGTNAINFDPSINRFPKTSKLLDITRHYSTFCYRTKCDDPHISRCKYIFLHQTFANAFCTRTQIVMNLSECLLLFIHLFTFIVCGLVLFCCWLFSF
jgi:hypothetical protein